MAKIHKETLDKWFDFNVNEDTRTIYMGSEEGVDANMAEYIIKGMHLLEAKSAEQPITILMNNPGGDFFHGLAIYDAIKTAKCHVTIKVYGHAMSMGSIILQAADHRVMMPNSRFMIHYGYDAQDNHTKTVMRWIDESKRLAYLMENTYLDVMLEREEKEGEGYLAKTLSDIMTKQHALDFPPSGPKKYSFSKKYETKREELRKVVQEMLNFDTILTAEETVALGFADEVHSNS